MSDRKQPSRVPKIKRAASVSVDSYRDDSLYPRIVRAVEPILARGKVVAPLDVLIGMGLLDPARLEDWRFGRVPYLEKVINCNLTRLSRLLRILRFHAHDLKLVPSTTAYLRLGKGPKQRLRFTKTGEGKREEAYSLHFVWPGKGPFHLPAPRHGSRSEPHEEQSDPDLPRCRDD
jgi:hypothetical protein